MDKANLTKEQKEKIIAAMRSCGAVVGYLFGSYARGTANLRSDIDVAVVFPYEMAVESQENRVEDIRNNLEKIFGADKVDVINAGTIKNPLLLYLATLGEGVVLFADNVSIKNSVAARALRDFEDTEYLRHIQSASLKKLFA
ncbi:MAG: polymerase beta domain protein region protein [Parcubacteria group bacterium GW2011_GWA1_40_21]|nr:MAG: polymerase beta domain protein region protein [Parcubacteria group bacterium GW2011_GWC1_40_13]KKR53539.1 MAG: polymerase beta domain protein region protein [Parcubacteria group bacterium GW2011_GWA1_40_21]